MNRTLELFWRTVEVCGMDKQEALDIIEKIERKNSFNVYNLPEKDIDGKVKVNLSPEDLAFIQQLRIEKNMSRFYKITGFSDKALRRMEKKGLATFTTYERFTNARQRWEFWLEKEKISKDRKRRRKNGQVNLHRSTA